MGNATAKNKVVLEGTLARLLDKIAAKFITTQNFTDLQKLNQPEYCDKLIVLTSKIFDESLDHQQVDYLAQRTRRGIIIDKMARDKIYYGHDLTKLGVKKGTKKTRLCIGIAKFYIKIAHVFAAILKTLNPEYVMRNAAGDRQKISIGTKDAMFSSSRVKRTRSNNFCQRRINALTPQIDGYHDMVPHHKINICSVNRRALQRGVYGPMEKVIGFMDLIGMETLDKLYKIGDSGYDYRLGIFTKMSDNAKKDYKTAVDTFYKIFTGKKNVPPNITSFASIPLSDYHNKPACDRRRNGAAVTNFRYDPKVSPYKEYANHLATMMGNFTGEQLKLAEILKQIFAKQINKDTKRIEYTLNPKLTNKMLDEIILKTRNIILQLYSQCEADFHAGIKLFETIIEKKEQAYNDGMHRQLQEEMGSLV